MALVGPNGAGKSTLLLHLNGLLPGKAAAASATPTGPGATAATAALQADPSVWIDGLEVSERTAPEVRRRVGLVFQDPDDQLFCNTVLEDVAFGPLNQGKSPGRGPGDRGGMPRAGSSWPRLADRPPHHLSFGERKRACLAGVLACGPSVLVLDEPSANLDPAPAGGSSRSCRGLTCTKLIATHDLEMVLEVCPRTVVLDAGRVAADGESRAILGDAALMEAHGLERPLSLKRSDADPHVVSLRIGVTGRPSLTAQPSGTPDLSELLEPAAKLAQAVSSRGRRRLPGREAGFEAPG